jgi:hypothetical protein
METARFKFTELNEANALPNGRTFAFHRDTFAFANETKWRYGVDSATGRQTAVPRVPEPDYTLHCFTVARATRQFWWHAHFEPSLPATDDAAYRRLIRAVASSSVQKSSNGRKRIIIPGYAGLREFSATRETLLKAECGGAWRSYFQRGNWRMVFPFLRAHQKTEASRLLSTLRQGRLPIVHVLRFPQLTINHALLLFGVQETAGAVEFRAYDPNIPEREITLTYDHALRTFTLPPLHYFVGGRVDVYEIYRGWVY